MRTVTRSVLICFFFLLVSASNSLATQYFVDAGAKDVGDGSLEKPFATVQQAADVMQPGDVCIVREGIYREVVRPKNSGTAKGPLVFRAFPGETAMLSGFARSQDGRTRSAIPTVPWFPCEWDTRIKSSPTARCSWKHGGPNAGKPAPKGLLEFETATMDKGTTPTKIVDNALPNVDLAGVRIWVSTFKRWYCWTGAVKAKMPGRH